MANIGANVWTQMNYVPPRGQCNYKESLLSSRCPCLRFMLHPLKSSSSYECDGCSHHASFHSMENKAEDEIRKRWEQEAKEKLEQEKEGQQRPKKRVRAIEFNGNGFPAALNLGNIFGVEAADNGAVTRARPVAAKKPTRNASSRARNRASESTEDDGTVVELD